ncbi:MAG: hypothetical protein PHG65_03640 [Kiritimatiellae bacterium]|nr:hypothetical protein [Kiritimatiellia bacterium]
MDLVEFGPQTANLSEGCFPDAQRPFFVFTTPTPRTRNLLSTNRYRVAVSARGHGAVSPTGVVEVLHGFDQVFNITSETYYVVDQVLSNGAAVEGVSGCSNASLILHFVTGPIDVEASFKPVTSTNGTPLFWMAAYGLTNAPPDEEALADDDGDGYSAVEEFVAGTVPVDSNSCFMLSDMRVGPDGSAVLTWNPSQSGRVYRILRANEPAGPLQEVTNLYYPANCHTVQPDQACGFYRVRVEVP